MDWTQIRSNWDVFKGRMRSKWGKLTDDDLQRIGGKKDELVARLRERYGMAKDKAERQVDQWLDSLDPKKKGKKEPPQPRR